MNLSRSASARAHLSRPAVARLIVEVLLCIVGAALVACALIANQRHLDQHILPSFLLSRLWIVRLEWIGRIVSIALGLSLALAWRPRVGRFVERSPALALRIVVAGLLALAASDLVLTRLELRPAEWLFPDEEPLRRSDPQLGWTLVSSRIGRPTIGGRPIEYAIDANGYRVRRVDEAVDPNRPTLLFSGESVMFGEGLTWEESIPGQVSALVGVQSANLAVHGFATDQAYMRLTAEVARFRQPVAIVSLFMPTLFGRNLNDDRPHFAPGLVWRPGEPRSRVRALLQLFVPYRSHEAIERGIVVTREVFRATCDLARAHRAMPLVVVPQFGPEERLEQTLRHRILDEGHVPYVTIEIDPTWRLPWDRHPDPRAARAIANAIAARLGHSTLKTQNSNND